MRRGCRSVCRVSVRAILGHSEPRAIAFYGHWFVPLFISLRSEETGFWTLWLKFSRFLPLDHEILGPLREFQRVLTKNLLAFYNALLLIGGYEASCNLAVSCPSHTSSNRATP